MFKLKSRHGGLPRRHGPRFSPGNRAGSGIGQQRLCRVAIRRDLGRQRVHAVELRFGADEGVKGDVDVLAIKVAGKVEEIERKSVVKGKSVSVRVDLGGRRILNKKTRDTNKIQKMR